MSVPPDLVAFHVGIVVRDLHAVMDRYQRMFALEHWHIRDPQLASRCASPTAGAKARASILTDTACSSWCVRDLSPPTPLPGGGGQGRA